MQAQATEAADDYVDLDQLGAFEIEAGDRASGVVAKPEETQAPESDTLLVTALNAVARLRDTVDRLCIFDQARRMLENEHKLLDQQIAREQRLLRAIIANGQARLQALHARRESVRRALQPTEPEAATGRVGSSSNRHRCAS